MGCIVISATNGHDVKYSASEKLQNEVDEWLSKGNSVKTYVCTILDKKDDRKNPEKEVEKNKVKQETKRRNKKFEERVSIQQPILEMYYNIADKDTCWHDLALGTNGAISKTHAYRTFKGTTSIKDSEMWKIVKDYILKKVAEYETSKKEASC